LRRARHPRPQRLSLGTALVCRGRRPPRRTAWTDCPLRRPRPHDVHSHRAREPVRQDPVRGAVRLTVAGEKIGVVGAGLMGAEIALNFALAGHEVRLNDRSEELLAAAMARLGSVLDRGIQRGFFAPEDKAPALARILPTTALADFADCGFVTEAVFED